VPVSKVRKKKNVTRTQQVAAPTPAVTENPGWFAPVMAGLLILGLLWIVVFYLTAGSWHLPIPGIGNWNLLIGFLLIIAGGALATRWR
jgi:hypothetical protein